MPWVLASSRIRAASVRASASCSLYCCSAASAASWAFSAFSMPPWIAAVRSAYVASKRGTTALAITNVSSRAKITAMMISSGAGASGFSVASGMRQDGHRDRSLTVR